MPRLSPSRFCTGPEQTAAQNAHLRGTQAPHLLQRPGREAPEPEGRKKSGSATSVPPTRIIPKAATLGWRRDSPSKTPTRRAATEVFPFDSSPVWSENPWGTGVARLARLVYSEPIWAVIGSIDGASTHLVEQVVAKARIPLVNPYSTDKTIHMANVPWMFSCVPGDHRLAEVLAQAVSDKRILGNRLVHRPRLAGLCSRAHENAVSERFGTELSLLDESNR